MLQNLGGWGLKIQGRSWVRGEVIINFVCLSSGHLVAGALASHWGGPKDEGWRVVLKQDLELRGKPVNKLPPNEA